MDTPTPLSLSRDRAPAGYAWAATAAVLWSFIAPFSKGALEAGLPPMEIAFWRALVGCLCFGVHAALTGGLRIPLRDAAVFCGFGVWGVAALFASLQTSIKLSGAATAMVLLYTAPAWVAVGSRLFFREAVTGRKLAGIGVALAGALLIGASGGSLPEEFSLLGIVCGFIAGLAYASHFPFFVWSNARHATATIYAYMLLGGTVCLYPFVDFAPQKPMEGWLYILLLGVLTNYIAYVALAKSLRLISQIEAAVIGNIEPVLATLWVWLFYGENFTVYGWLGCGLVIGAVFILTMPGKKAAT